MLGTMNWLRRLAGNRLLDVGAGLLALLVLGRLAWALPSRASKLDFSHYYVSSRPALEGQNPYTCTLEAESRRWGFVGFEQIPRATNPPTLVWLVAAVAWAPPVVAFWAWTTLQVMCLVIVLGLTRWLLHGRLSARGWWFLLAGVVSSPTIYYHFWFSQVQLLLAALVLGGFACLQRGHRAAACALVTTAGLLKLFPLMLLPWFLWRGGEGGRALWRRAGVTIVVGLGVVSATGWGLWRDYFRFAAPILADYTVRRSVQLFDSIADLECVRADGGARRERDSIERLDRNRGRNGSDDRRGQLLAGLGTGAKSGDGILFGNSGDAGGEFGSVGPLLCVFDFSCGGGGIKVAGRLDGGPYHWIRAADPRVGRDRLVSGELGGAEGRARVHCQLHPTGWFDRAGVPVCRMAEDGF